VREVYLDILRRLSQNLLRGAAGDRLGHFTDVVVQDGSSFAVHDALAETFGGRFTKIRPAAVELHTFSSVFKDQVLNAQLAPDKEAERAFLPRPEELTGKLLLADRGYQGLEYWQQLTLAGASFVMRGKSDLNPHVLRVRGPGGCLTPFEGHRLQEVLPRLPRRRLDLVVQWNFPRGETLRLRMILIKRTPKKEPMILVTNVPRSLLTARQVTEVYRLRWQIELIFKEWKSYANLHEFASANPALVEGLIWASLCAAALKRSLAHAGQRTGSGVAISTGITAMCGAHILPDLLRCALRGFSALEGVLENIFRYLWNNAARAHPERDRLEGRMRFGLEYVGVKT
jgi:DDE family transposase